MDKRRKLTPAKVDEIIAMLDEGMTLESVGRAMGVSTSHVQRLRAARKRGAVKTEPTSLSSCAKLIATGLPFKRTCWDRYFYFFDLEDQWFITRRYMDDNGHYEIVEYGLHLSLEDLMAKDWVVLTWESVNDDKRTD